MSLKSLLVFIHQLEARCAAASQAKHVQGEERKLKLGKKSIKSKPSKSLFGMSPLHVVTATRRLRRELQLNFHLTDEQKCLLFFGLPGTMF